ncbi:telomerase-binding protein EST1A isoform X2 [Tribolium madens]|uniref:telomerase-binding protein EST1A isoform X2 n=1 Tax=Tribolium madens TaxID=41895 RepID=UPI001CF73682|nr:telomerase-binding protein EST1A isoform X2 [Tribolium madens]
MKRGKPQQEIYRPGSGPLRKSNTGNEESDPDLNLKPKPYAHDDKYKPETITEPQRKPRKPEQMLYVPRAVANAREMSQDNDRHTLNGNYDDKFAPRSKRYSNRRHGGGESDHEWRQMRQGSEPRGVPNGAHSRMRDTRSVEPSGPPPRNYEKSHTKPPSGRRHSTIGLESDKRPPHKSINVDKLPPRFRRKMLEDNKLNQGVEDDWNGASLTFQGSSNYHPVGGYYPNTNQNYYQNVGYCTLPNRHRGRGRLHQEGEYRSRTPDLGISSPCNSRPPTPPYGRTKSNDNLNRVDRPASPRNYDYRRNGRERNNRRNHGRNKDDRRNQNYEVQEENWAEEERVSQKVETRENTPPITPPTPEEKIKSTVPSSSNTILDWSEEVELHDQLEAEALSDAMTRSSSVASLVDISIKSMPPNINNPKKSKKRSNRRNKGRSGSRPRDSSLDNSKSTFRAPQEPRGRRNRRHSRDRRDSSYDRRSRNPSRESSFDRNRRSSTNEPENWREEIRSRQNSEREFSDRSRRNSERETEKINVKKAGVLILPPKQQEMTHVDQPRYPEVRKPCHQKSLFDHNNPSKPIIVKSQSSRVSVPGFSDNTETTPPQMYTTDQFGNIRPGWYDESSDGFKSCHYPNLIRDIKRADNELQYIMNSGQILISWGTVESLRQFLKEALQYLLCKDLKFCEAENVEQHLWKILYHNIIEVTRKAITNDPGNKEQYKGFLLYLIDEGTNYLESLLDSLEESYKFKLSTFLGNNNNSQKGLGYVGLALISAQKLLLFLGDLGRYREQVNETSNYGKCRQWYIKAHEINPKNGKPYNQLAVLAVYARRKLDAVYYYMRSLMSSNPVPSAREYLISLFDENRKKYEQGERKRREERLERAKQHMKQKESEDPENAPGSLRHETWIRPDGGRRVHRTTQTVQEQQDSEEEDLAALSSVEVNKRFVISYLHVHGKLITRIGMESFQEAAMQMLKEFRALLQHSPVPLPCNRFLQLLALNMFAIESTQLKDPQLQMQAGYRSELQERALVVSLQMFNLILERCVSLLEESNPENLNSLHQDVHVLLPAVKIWCDWMLCHSAVWNPPPSTQDFRVGNSGDTWSRLATLMNILEKLDQTSVSALISDYQEGYEQVKLPEDIVLNGFTPLMVNEPDISYAPKDLDVEVAQFALRMNKLLFFGTVFLCGLEPPVLKLEIEDDFREYVSVVCTSNSRESPVTAQGLVRNNDVLMESFSDEEEDEILNGPGDEAPSEVRELLNRKVELERTHRRQELHKQRVKKILSQAVVSVHIEVRPKYLVPDTNCFIDHLDPITTITSSHVYTLMVPIVVLSELEGLSRGGKSPIPSTRSMLDPQHVRKVAQAAKRALSFLKSRPQAVKCVTTKGAVLSSTTFTTEDDSMLDATFKNDDKILATCLVLSKGHREQQQSAENEPKKLVSEVVLLTDDRNLRVKALARDVPVRELLDFMQWAGLG